MLRRVFFSAAAAVALAVLAASNSPAQCCLPGCSRAFGELPNDSDTLLLLHFNSDLNGAGAETPIADLGTSFRPGLFFDGAHIDNPGYIRYATAGNINPVEGTVEFWIKPDWDGDQEVPRTFFEVGNNFNNGILVGIDGANSLRFLQWGDDPNTPELENHVERGLHISGAGWIAGNWYHVAATWNSSSQELAFYIDGELVASRADAVTISAFSTTYLEVGAETANSLPAEAILEEFRVYGRARSSEEIGDDYCAGLVAPAPATYSILRDDDPVALPEIAVASIPWTDPDPVLTPAYPSLMFYQVEGLARIHMVRETDTVSIYAAWPNQDSSANSDPWIIEHHDELGLMSPRVLVLNFSNNINMTEVKEKTEQLIKALAESTRWHGYDDPAAPVFLQYQVDKYVDLREVSSGCCHSGPPQVCDNNSAKYPRRADWVSGEVNNFEYSALYDEPFTTYYGYPDPNQPTSYLSLAELVDRGIINELWFFANHVGPPAGTPDECGGPLELVEEKQFYDETFNKTGHGPAGNGSPDDPVWIGRSLKILFINAHRGIGCAVHNFGHGLEAMSRVNAIPYYTHYFQEYGGYDLDTRWGLPFDTFYAYSTSEVCPPPIPDDQNEYPDPETLKAYYDNDFTQVDDYYAIGGNVHFPPNGRCHYDDDNQDPVMSSIKSWRIGNGPGGSDLLEPFTNAVFEDYNAVADDCEGGWQLYWRQSMPGLDNLAKDDCEGPMRNWWPFLFY